MSTNLDAVAEEQQAKTVGADPNEVNLVINMSSVSTIEMDVEQFGKIMVHIQGDIQDKNKKAVFLTVHDIGTNHAAFQDFVEQPCMSEIKARSIFIHLDLPGQSDGAPDMGDDFVYPTIQQLGEVLIPAVLDALKVKLVVAIGEGAGANILSRFAISYPSRVLGLVLIHLVTAGVGMLAKLKESWRSGKRRQSESFAEPVHVIALHKFGPGEQTPGAESGSTSPDGESRLKEALRSRVANINPKNLRKFVEAYMNRKDISDRLTHLKATDLLLVVGGKSPVVAGVTAIHGRMDKSNTSLLKIDDVIDVIHEAPEKFAHGLLLFVKGLGYLTSLTLPGVDRQRTFSGESPSADPGAPPNSKTLGVIGRRRTLSMEEYDLPRPRRLSLTNPTPATAAAVSPK